MPQTPEKILRCLEAWVRDGVEGSKLELHKRPGGKISCKGEVVGVVEAVTTRLLAGSDGKRRPATSSAP